MMIKHNPNNERIKHKYMRFLKEARGQNVCTIDSVAMALDRYEAYTKYADFKKFHYKKAVGFKNNLTKQIGKQSCEKLSKSTLNTTLRHLVCFFQWLYMQPGYKSHINYTDTMYFKLSKKDTRVATASRTKQFPTLEQIKHVIDTMPTETIIDRRNRALVAFVFLTGARVSAIVSLKLKHVDLIEKSVFQDARQVDTKFSKTFKTYFFPVGDEILQIVEDWVNFLRKEMLWGNGDPLFPQTAVTNDESLLFVATGIKKEHWSDASPIRKIFKDAFTSAGLQYFNPHLVRDTLIHLAETMCVSIEEFKAWSQNIGHEKVLVTLLSYGEVQENRQGELIKNLAKKEEPSNKMANEIAEAVIRKLELSQSL